MPADHPLDALRAACADRAREGTAADAVSGVVPRYVASPASTEQTAALLRAAARHDLRVVARGAGTKLGWGTPPTGVDVVVDTTEMSGVVEHVSGDLVCVVRAGTPVAELQAHLAGARQQLALDSPLSLATVGGTIAASTSGPRRLLYGTPRDLIIGITFVRADGVVAKAGGKVVKNVAGYDFGKLLTGSFGTLGVITEAVVRLHPVPAAHRWVTLVADPATAVRSAAAVLGSQLSPSAVELDSSAPGEVRLTVLLEGIEAGVTDRASRAVDLLGGDAAVTADPPDGFYRYPFGPADTGLKVTCTITGVGDVLDCAARLAREHDVQLAVRGSAMGVLHAGLPAGTQPATVATVVDGLRATAAAHDGSLTVLTAPPDVRTGLDVWGPVPGLHLMRRLKDQLDPEHRLSPGRFVGGI
jgi:glycolate oxidase FAD binding subunit